MSDSPIFLSDGATCSVNGRVVWVSRAYHDEMLASGAEARMDRWTACEHGHTAPTWACVRCIVKVEETRERLLAQNVLAVRDIP